MTKKIMIVDDEKDITQVLQDLFEFSGYEAIPVFDGLSALEKLTDGCIPDLIVLDLFMPGLGGKEFLRQMRKLKNLESIPVIIITGAVHTTEAYPPEGTYKAVIEKPFDLEDVLELVGKYAQ